MESDAAIVYICLLCHAMSSYLNKREHIIYTYIDLITRQAPLEVSLSCLVSLLGADIDIPQVVWGQFEPRH